MSKAETVNMLSDGSGDSFDAHNRDTVDAGDPVMIRAARSEDVSDGMSLDSDGFGDPGTLNPDIMSRIKTLRAQTPQGDLDLPAYHQSLGTTFFQRYTDSKNLHDLEASIIEVQKAVDMTPEGHPERAVRLQYLSVLVMFQSCEDVSEDSDKSDDLEINYAISCIQEVMGQTPEGHADLPGYHEGLGVILLQRYKESGNLQDLEDSVTEIQKALNMNPNGNPDRARQFQHLSVSLTHQYQKWGKLEDIDAALHARQQAVELTPEEHPDRVDRLKDLGLCYRDRYQRFGNLEDLEAALHANQEALKLTPKGHSDRAYRLKSLAICLRDRYKEFGNLEDLEAALCANQEAVELSPGDPYPLASLAVSLRDRYRRFGNLENLEAALHANREAVELIHIGHRNRPYLLQGLALSFRDRYERLGNPEDLEATLHAYQEAARLTTAEHPDRAIRLKDLGLSIRDRYQRFGNSEDLEAALHAHQEALALTPEGHPDRADRLQLLAVSIRDRYQRFGNLQDLEAALCAYQEALQLTPEGNPDRAYRLHGLGVSFRDRYVRFGNLQDLEAALHTDQEALDLTPEGHPDRAWRLQNLGVSMRDRYERLDNLEDLKSVLRTKQEAVKLTPEGDIMRAYRLQSLALSLRDQYMKLGNVEDLKAALCADQEAVKLTPEGHPERSRRLQCLAGSFTDQYRSMRKLEDLEAVHIHYSSSFKTHSASPEHDWTQALKWAAFATEFQPPDGLHAYRAAFNLLPELLWIGLSIPMRHDAIHRLDVPQASSTAMATCISLCDLASAVEIMEQGLATTFQQMLQLKADVGHLHPDQAKTFQNLSSQLYSGASTNAMAIANARNKLIEDIRKEPGLEYFLLPKPYNVLSQASQGGPVVILNSHKNHCDALIIPNPTSQPIHVPFPNVTLELLKSQREILRELLVCCDVRNRGVALATRKFQREGFPSKQTQESFSDMLDWLWTHILSPVYQALASHGILDGRLWWLPTGAFTGLPLHASPPTAKNQFIHSYTATLGSLLDAYAKKPSSTSQKIAVVGVTHTGPGAANFLNGVGQEVAKVLSIVREHDVQFFEGEQATVDAVKSELEDCSWAHLACHGRQDLDDPIKSNLQLYGGTLELETILQMPLANAQVVFLAACQTAMGDAELVNESFHLGGGFIAAGFRGAIGTLWSMNDEDGPTVAEIVYSHLFRDGKRPQATDAAKALHLAVEELKRRNVAYERWIPFIHMGI